MYHFLQKLAYKPAEKQNRILNNKKKAMNKIEEIDYHSLIIDMRFSAK